jgi:hypothetical protein
MTTAEDRLARTGHHPWAAVVDRLAIDRDHRVEALGEDGVVEEEEALTEHTGHARTPGPGADHRVEAVRARHTAGHSQEHHPDTDMAGGIRHRGEVGVVVVGEEEAVVKVEVEADEALATAPMAAEVHAIAV